MLSTNLVLGLVLIVRQGKKFQVNPLNTTVIDIMLLSPGPGLTSPMTLPQSLIVALSVSVCG